MISFYRAPGSSMGGSRSPPCPPRGVGPTSTQGYPKSFLTQPQNPHKSPWVNNPWCLAREDMVTSKFIPKPVVLLYPLTHPRDGCHCHLVAHKGTGISVHGRHGGSLAHTSGSGLT